MSLKLSKILYVTFLNRTITVLKKMQLQAAKWQSDEQSHTQKLNSLDLFVLGGQTQKMTWMSLSQWLKQAALYGRMSSLPITVRVPATFSSLLSAYPHGPAFPNKPDLTCEAGGTASAAQTLTVSGIHSQNLGVLTLYSGTLLGQAGQECTGGLPWWSEVKTALLRRWPRLDPRPGN